MDFKTRLKELRKENSISQTALANVIGTSADCIYDWEKGRSEPSINEIIALAKYFEVSTDYLLGVKDFY